MSNSAAAKEPSMEEILASIRRIISDETDGATADVMPEVGADEGGAETMTADPAPQTATDSSGDDDATMSEEDLDALFAADAPSEADPVSDEAADDDIMELTEDQFAEASANPAEFDAMPASDMEDDMSAMAADPMGDIDFDAIETGAAEGDLPAEDSVPSASMDDMELASAASVDEIPASESLEALVSAQAEKAVASAFSDLSSVVINQQSRTMDQLVQDMLRPMLKEWLDTNLPPMVERMVASEIKRLTGR